MLTHLRQPAAPPSRVVVLGARGFVAAAVLVRLREAGVAALGLSSADLDLTTPGASNRLASTLREDDALVFVSALTPDRGRDIATMMKNLHMGQQVCAALAARPCAHVVYLSTDAVYAEAASLIRESTCAEPGSFHGTMHVLRERMLQETLKASRTPLALLRPTLLYGSGDTHNGYGPNRFVRTALADGTISLFGGGEEKRDYVEIGDLAGLVERVLTHGSAGVLNVATGRSMRFDEVAGLVGEACGGQVRIVQSERTNPITHRHFDVSALIAAFPDFRFTDPRAGVAAMVRQMAAPR